MTKKDYEFIATVVRDAKLAPPDRAHITGLFARRLFLARHREQQERKGTPVPPFNTARFLLAGMPELRTSEAAMWAGDIEADALRAIGPAA